MSENNMENMEYEVIELIDEEGNSVEFDWLANLELEGKEYIVVTPSVAEDDEEEEAEVIMLSIETDENGDEYYAAVEDEMLQERLFSDFLKLLDDAEGEE